MNPPAPAPASGPRAGAGDLFVYEVRRDGRPVVVLHGVQAGAGVTVDAEIYPTTGPPEQEPARRPFPFATRDQALRFVDDALTALQYLDCVVAD